MLDAVRLIFALLLGCSLLSSYIFSEVSWFASSASTC
jgi:hypothetical protein